ncbi:hypothetical protein B0H13DRAFT_2263456, partial [Mycena leptocephala]
MLNSYMQIIKTGILCIPKFGMSSLPELEACLSILLSALPAPSNTNITILILVLAFVAAGIMHYTSPLCPTRSLVEKIYLDALETGLLSTSDIDTAEMVSILQLKVSKIREVSLRNSLSHSGTLLGFCGGHTVTLLCCIREVRMLETHIEILKENQVCEDNQTPSRIVRLWFVFAVAAIP